MRCRRRSCARPADPGAFEFTASLNRSIPTILKYITTGKPAGTATLTVRSDASGNRAGFAYAKYTFTEAFFTNVGQGLGGAGRAESAVAFVYRSVKAEVFAPGSPSPVSCVLWDVPGGTASDCP